MITEAGKSEYARIETNEVFVLCMIFFVGIFALIFMLSAIRKIADWLYIKYPVVNGVITNINAQVATIKIDVEYDYKGRKRNGTTKEKIEYQLTEIPKYQIGDTMRLHRNPFNGKIKYKILYSSIYVVYIFGINSGHNSRLYRR